MESHSGEAEVGTGGSSGTHPVLRWSPKKEQISLLEYLYQQGIRCPNADQIEEITSTLSVYGPIEGKNVFYWFQNHKARQRQKQKQERIAYYNRYLHASQPNFSPTLCQNAVCAPYCVPQSETSFCPQHPNVHVPGDICPRTEEVLPKWMPRTYDVPQIYEQWHQRIPEHDFSKSKLETLDLFPMHPTGILEGKITYQVSSRVSLSADSSTDTSSGSPGTDEDGRQGNQPFFNFLTSGQVS